MLYIIFYTTYNTYNTYSTCSTYNTYTTYTTYITYTTYNSYSCRLRRNAVTPLQELHRYSVTSVTALQSYKGVTTCNYL